MVPPAENGAFFVTTNVVITPNQTWGECPEVSTARYEVESCVAQFNPKYDAAVTDTIINQKDDLQLLMFSI